MNAWQTEQFLYKKGIFFDPSVQKFRVESRQNHKWMSKAQMLSFLEDSFSLQEALRIMLNIVQTRAKIVKVEKRQRK